MFGNLFSPPPDQFDLIYYINDIEDQTKAASVYIMFDQACTMYDKHQISRYE